MSHKCTLNAEIKTVEKQDGSGNLIISGYANMATKDRGGDLIPGSAWKDALRNYEKNPIILFNHDYNEPIGKMTNYTIDDSGLFIEAEISPAAGKSYQLVQDGVLRTFSVGFSIGDAEYDKESDTFNITKVNELYEVSVVSVPMNQDSTFNLRKSIDDFESFSETYKPTPEPELVPAVEPKKEVSKVSEKTIQEQVAEQVALIKEAEQKDLAKKAAAKQADKELNDRIVSGVSTASETIVATLQKSLLESKEEFAKQLADLQDEIVKNAESVKAESLKRTNKLKFIGGTPEMEEKKIKQDMEDAYLLGLATRKGLNTVFGTALQEKLNTSSSYDVSSDSYESLFTTNLHRDIQDELILAPLFRTIQMQQANLVLPIRPNASKASWVGSATYGTDATTGTEYTAALTEITLTTRKLATKSYMTDETTEDAILPILPLIREDLVRNHANEIEASLLTSTGANTYKGLIQLATDGTNMTEVTAAVHDGTVKVTAKMLLEGRRRLGKWGLNIRDLVFVVSQSAYYDLHEDAAYADVQQVGTDMAIKRTGQVGMVYGIPVIVSEAFAAPADNGSFAVCLNARNFVRPVLRGLNVQSDYDVEKQRQVLVATQRIGFNQIIAGQAVVSYSYS